MAQKSAKVSININLLKPQTTEKSIFSFTRWLLSTGRFIVVLVEIVVLAAFVSRFKLDADLATTKEKVEQQIPFIESLRADEIAIRQTQLQLSTIKQMRLSSPSHSDIFRKISAQTPQGLRINNIGLENKVGDVEIKISGTSQTNNELLNLVTGLRETGFENVTIAGVSLDESQLTFTVTCSINAANLSDQQL